MKRIDKIIVASFLALMIPAAFVSGQDKKSGQQIKITVAEDGGSKVLIDTLITGDSPKDSINLRGGKTIYLTRSVNDDADVPGGSGKYIVTTTVTDGNDSKREVTKEVSIITSESGIQDSHENVRHKQARCEELAGEGNYTYSVVSDNKKSDSDIAKYVLSKNGLRITVEGSDYDKVKEVIKNIEKTLDEQGQTKK
jgi:hypothetical protein